MVSYYVNTKNYLIFANKVKQVNFVNILNIV